METYTDRPWVKRYDPGIPGSLAPYPDTPLYDMLRAAAAKNPDATALITSARLPVAGRVAAELTYRELDQASDALAVALIKMGLQKGDRVTLIMPNSAPFVISYFGVLKAGGVVAACNPTFPAEKMCEQINDSGARFAITLTLFYDTLKSIQARTPIKNVIVAKYKDYLPTAARILFTLAKEKKTGHKLDALQSGDHWLSALLKQYDGQKPNVQVSGDDIAIFQYTGGTTGVPKAAVSTHKALVANTTQCRVVLMGRSETISDEIFLGAIPFFHVYGMVTIVGFAISIGAKIALVPNARDINDLLDTIDTFKPTIFMGVPALYNAINNHPDVQANKFDLSSIRCCISGSAPLPPATKREFERITGGKVLEGYGLSETPTTTHVNPLHGENRAGSIGLPLPDVECKIISLDDGVTELPVGEVGELVMHCPQMMIGYHEMPTETANALRELDETGKKWLFTGDIARMDEDGYFYIVDRKKDLALIGGFNVYPNTVEKVLSEHPGIVECGVAAVPHPEKHGQEALKAWVVVRDGFEVTHEEMIEHCMKYLARYEVPTRFAVVKELPKTTVGKTLRRELVRSEMEEREQATSTPPDEKLGV